MSGTSHTLFFLILLHGSMRVFGMFFSAKIDVYDSQAADVCNTSIKWLYKQIAVFSDFKVV